MSTGVLITSLIWFAIHIYFAIVCWMYRLIVRCDSDHKFVRYIRVFWPFRRKQDLDVSQVCIRVHRLPPEHARHAPKAIPRSEDIVVVGMSARHVALMLATDTRSAAEKWLAALPTPLRERVVGEGAEFSVRMSQH
ncbi:MAG: hypothetical protein EA376_07225 [Phycisphaeraceae bacterium]|nr:MAG: hypothetical protein EA376_07225 [Phycisphaeraceae bacterium]